MSLVETRLFCLRWSSGDREPRISLAVYGERDNFRGAVIAPHSTSGMEVVNATSNSPEGLGVVIQLWLGGDYAAGEVDYCLLADSEEAAQRWAEEIPTYEDAKQVFWE